MNALELENIVEFTIFLMFDTKQIFKIKIYLIM